LRRSGEASSRAGGGVVPDGTALADERVELFRSRVGKKTAYYVEQAPHYMAVCRLLEVDECVFTGQSLESGVVFEMGLARLLHLDASVTMARARVCFFVRRR
jgi:hypothetical protein